MANKLVNFRCPDSILEVIESYGREHYPTAPSKRGTIDYDQSKVVKDFLIAGIETLTGIKIETKPKSDSEVIAELLDKIAKLESAIAGK